MVNVYTNIDEDYSCFEGYLEECAVLEATKKHERIDYLKWVIKYIAKTFQISY